MKSKIAVVQFGIYQLSWDDNLKKAEEFIKKAVTQNADIIVFSENFVAGTMGWQRGKADTNNRFRNHFQMLAKKYKIDIVPGSVIEKVRSLYYNTTYYVDSSGQVLSRYRKINLWLPERKY